MRYIKNLVKAAFILAAIVLCMGSAKAQLDPNFNIKLHFSPPVSPYLSDWQSRTSTAMIVITNLSGSARMCRVVSYIYINGVEVANTRAKAYNLPVVPIPVGVTTYSGESLVPLSAVHFDNNVDQSSQRANRIPDGLLCIKLELEEVPSIKILAEKPKDEECALVLSYSPPRLILPDNKVELCRLGYNNVISRRDGSPMPLFQWTPITPVPITPVTYHFAIYEVLGNQEPIAAFRGGRAIFQRDLVGLTSLLWPTEYFLPEKGKNYMWSVRALDDQGRPFVLTNDGWAEPYRFIVSQGDCSTSSVAGYDAKYISSRIPTCMTPGQAVQVSVTMLNSGATTWKAKGDAVCYPGASPLNAFKFSSTLPKVDVAPGMPSTFTFTITAPQEPGFYNFSARMFLNQSGVGGPFGEPSTSTPIQVIANCTENGGTGNNGGTSGGNGNGDNGTGGGANNGNGANGDPNQTNGKNLANLYDPRTSYRFIPLGARFMPSTSSANMDYMLPQFSVHVPGRHDWIYKDEKGNTYPFSIQIPEEMRFSAIHPPYEESLAEFTGGDPKEMKSPGGAMPHVKIQSLGNNGSPQGPPIDAYFNPKEIGIDKSVPWQKHKNTEGDAPTLEFTAADPKNLSCELMFDMFEEKKSVIPLVEGLANKLPASGTHPQPNSDLALFTFTFGNMPPVKVKIDSLHVRYTMFLPDATPCRATVHLRMHHVDSIPPRKEAQSGSSHSTGQNNGDGSYMAMWGVSSDALPANAEPLMSDPSSKGSEGILIGLLRSNKGKMSDVKSNPMYEDRKMSFLGYRYKVDFEGGGTAFFKTVSGLESETEVVPYREGGVNESTHKIIGARKWPNIVLKQGFTGGESSRKFLAAVAVKTTTNRKGISITVYDRDGAPQRRYNFFECWPVKYEGPELNAKNNEVAIESLELSNEGVEIESMDEPIHNSYSGNFNTASGALSLQQKRMTFSVPTQFDGRSATILVTGILENTEILVRQHKDSVIIRSDPGAASQDIKKLFGHSQVDINATLPGGDWTSSARYISGDESSSSSSRSDDNRAYSGGHFALTLDGKNAGFIKNIEGGDIKSDVIEEPGKPTEIEVLPTSMGVYDWIKSSLSSTHLRKSGELQAADFKRDVRQVREFKDALITEVTFPALDGSAKDPGYIKLKFTPEITRNKKGSGKVENPVDVKQKMFFPGNFRMTIDGLEKACAKISKVDAIAIKQSTVTDDIGDTRDYQREPGKIDFPNIKITVSEEYAHDFWAWHEDFVIAGNNDESKHKHGSITYLDPTRSKELLTLDFECIGIFKGTAEASENNSGKIRKITYVLHVRRIIPR